MRFQPPAWGRSPSGIGRSAELAGPLSNSRNDPSVTPANAGAAFESTVKPRCSVYHAIAASTSSTMQRTLTVVVGVIGMLASYACNLPKICAAFRDRSSAHVLPHHPGILMFEDVAVIHEGMFPCHRPV